MLFRALPQVGKRDPASGLLIEENVYDPNGNRVATYDANRNKRVWWKDERTGTVSLQPVVHLKRSSGQPTVILALRGLEGAVETIEATTEHPFWVVGEGWVGASHLHSGDRIETALSGWLEVVEVRDSPALQSVYNFEVAVTHTYFVGRGEAWVHNQSRLGPPEGAPGATSLLREPITDPRRLLSAAPAEVEAAAKIAPPGVSRVPGSAAAGESGGTFLPEEYYQARLNGRAPVQSGPYSLFERFFPDGRLKQVTTYDRFGNRIRQFDLGKDARHSEGYHTFEYSETSPPAHHGGGIRSEHIPFD